MTCLISGETVTVRNAAHSLDELGEPAGEAVTETAVDNVVVCPGATADLDSTRPNGVTVAFTLCFPKGADVSLKDATVTVRGTDYKVVGDPKRYTARPLGPHLRGDPNRWLGRSARSRSSGRAGTAADTPRS